jgi:hypothetical protein
MTNIGHVYVVQNEDLDEIKAVEAPIENEE